MSKFFGDGWRLQRDEELELADATADLAEDLPDPVVEALDTWAKPVRLLTTVGTVISVRLEGAQRYADAQAAHSAYVPPTAPIDPMGPQSAPASTPRPAPTPIRRAPGEAAPPPPDPTAAAQAPYIRAVPTDPFSSVQ
jgi:hypothetical protein